jgi:hypothetical protein
VSLESLIPIDAPDLIDPVIGFRQWRLTDAGLCSLRWDEVWDEPTRVAGCRASGHPDRSAPAGECSCGIYAWYAPSPRTASAADYVTGAVVLWGAIELHATGMRAQHCRIVALALPFSRWAKRERLVDTARRLGVPAVPYRRLSRLAGDHGASIPREMRPPREGLAIGQAPIGVVPQLVNSATERLGARMSASSPARRRRS